MKHEDSGRRMKEEWIMDKFCVPFENLRKVNFDEFLAILPKKFDSEIASKMKNYRYRKSDTVSEIDEKNEPSSFENIDVRRTRSGQIFSLSVNMLKAKYLNEVESCSLSKLSINSNGAEKVSVWWLVANYGIITIGELFLSPMGLSIVSKLSPVNITSLMMGGWFLSTLHMII